jgi:hypothetical protein
LGRPALGKGPRRSLSYYQWRMAWWRPKGLKALALTFASTGGEVRWAPGTFPKNCAFAPTPGPSDLAMIEAPPPGAYTARVSGMKGRRASVSSRYTKSAPDPVQGDLAKRPPEGRSFKVYSHGVMRKWSCSMAFGMF